MSTEPVTDNVDGRRRWSTTSFLKPKSRSQPGPSTSESNAAPETEVTRPGKEVALIVVNAPITKVEVFETLWSNSRVRYFADGAANRLFDLYAGDEEKLHSYLPDLIKGDFDSIRDDVKEFYASKGVAVIHDPDQYATDLMKCIKSVEEFELREGRGQYDIVIHGGLNGRLDQTAHTLFILHTLSRTRKSQTWVVSGEDSICCLLTPGKHTIEVDMETQGPTCGLLPVGVDEAKIVTTGLRWNIGEGEWSTTSFQTRLSTSNHVAEDVVTVETDRPVIWTLEMR